MKSLLWKEWHEKRLWLIPLAISVLGMMPFGGYTFCENGGSLATALSFIVALLMGASSYASEIDSRSADFIYSRPVSWKKIIIAKLIVGLGMIISLSILAAVEYRFICPTPYAAFATLPALCIGIWQAVLMMGIGYMTGFVSSVILPGVTGSMLVLIVASVLAGLEVYLVSYTNTSGLWGRNNTYAINVLMLILLLVSWGISMLIAAILTARFGITLSLNTRFKRFGLMVLCGVVIIGVVEFVLVTKTKLIHLDPESTSIEAQISRDGKFVSWITSSPQDFSRSVWNHCYVSEVAGDKCRTIGSHYSGDTIPVWTSNDKFCLGIYTTVKKENQNQSMFRLATVHIMPGLRLDEKLWNYSGLEFLENPLVSPDGSKVLVTNYESDSIEMHVVDVGRRCISKSWLLKNSHYPWWQTNNKIGYINNHSNPQFIQVQ